VLKYTNQFNLLSKGMHFPSTTSLILSYKNQLLLLSLGSCLKQKTSK